MKNLTISQCARLNVFDVHCIALQSNDIWKLFSRVNDVHDDGERINLYDMKNEAVIFLCLRFFGLLVRSFVRTLMHFMKATCMHTIIHIVKTCKKKTHIHTPKLMWPSLSQQFNAMQGEVNELFMNDAHIWHTLICKTCICLQKKWA